MRIKHMRPLGQTVKLRARLECDILASDLAEWTRWGNQTAVLYGKGMLVTIFQDVDLDTGETVLLGCRRFNRVDNYREKPAGSLWLARSEQFTLVGPNFDEIEYMLEMGL